MRLPRPPTPPQALRLVAATLTVAIALVLGAVGSSGPRRPAYANYVALGDSFTAAPFVPLTDFARGCFRSRNNYPHLVAVALHIDDLKDRSCTGAQTHDLLTRQRTSRGHLVAPQLGALSRRTDLVTVGLGANDGRIYARVATTCRRTPGVCRLHDEGALLARLVDRVGPALVTSLREIRERAPRARVLLVSYPQLLPQHGDCSRLPRMRPQDRATFRTTMHGLVAQMRAAAEESDVELVDFYSASAGHDICSRNPWVQGRVGDSRRAAALHPLPAGQAALARMIEGVLRTFPPHR